MGTFVKIFALVAMVALTETRAWYAPNGEDDVADQSPSRSTRRREEDEEFAVEVFSPRSGRPTTFTSSTTPMPPKRIPLPKMAPPARPAYDKPAPPRRVVDHSYDYPEFAAAPNPTPPIGQSLFGVDLGSLSSSSSDSSEEGHTGSKAVPTTPPPTPAPAQVDTEETTEPEIEAAKNSPSSTVTVATTLQLVKLLRWPLVAVLLIAVLGTCLLSGCSVGLFGRRCFDTNTHRRTTIAPTPSQTSHDVTEEHLDLQTRRAISKGKPPKNLKVTFSTVPKEGAAAEEGEVEHVRTVRESDV